MHLPGTYQHSEETKAKIGAANKGRAPWCAGKRICVGPRQRDLVPYTCDLCGKEGERQFNRLKEPGKNFCVVCKDAYKRTSPMQNVRLPVKFNCFSCGQEAECQYRHLKPNKRCLGCAGSKNALNRFGRDKGLSREQRRAAGDIRGSLSAVIRRALGKKAYVRHNYNYMMSYNNEDFKNRIESLFVSGMSWENHGTWHVDHIKPVSAFLLEGVGDPEIINALSNLQPLWAHDNLSKNAKYP